ncbi:hypothetical protein H8S23_09380 [Anaerofilum sp. BX8]|uniref:Uncharacterized protein n=1 Tax=Anaerofilum hominis TaxID=2763016 RepID=A0A923I7H5_9FIRM|nr:hypothetical protein [Anaerofilum hominis]MBC5581718.1 hypothetical protein [Anaerofilum hominis]
MIDPDGPALAAVAAAGQMAEKTACGYFLLLRNKKQLISIRRGLRTGRMAAKK